MELCILYIEGQIGQFNRRLGLGKIIGIKRRYQWDKNQVYGIMYCGMKLSTEDIWQSYLCIKGVGGVVYDGMELGGKIC